MAKMTIEGQEKEIKFINVNPKGKSVSILFTDFTGLALEDVKIIVEDPDEES